MPSIRSLVFAYYTLLTSSIAYNSEIMNPCSYYIKKGLMCVIITDLSNCQPSSCSKCIKLNTRVLYNVPSVSLNKYISLTCLASL